MSHFNDNPDNTNSDSFGDFTEEYIEADLAGINLYRKNDNTESDISEDYTDSDTLDDNTDSVISKNITESNPPTSEIGSQKDDNQPLVKFVYDVKNEEEDLAFRAFQRRYTFKGNIFKSVIFALLGALFIQQVASNPSYTAGYALAAVSFLFIIFIWYNQRKIRQNLLRALAELEDDKYEFSLFDYGFTIRTIFTKEDGEMPTSEIPPSVVRFDSQPVDVSESNSLFMIFLRKKTIYILPKRCLSEDEISTLQEVFLEKTDDDYEVIK